MKQAQVDPARPGTVPRRSWLRKVLAPSRLTAVVDIGANPIDGDPPYRAMLDARLCTVLGFEPQAEARQRLNAAKGPHETYLADAVGDGEEHLLHVTAASGMTSLFHPDPSRLKLFNGFPGFGEVTGTVPVQTTRLDDVEELRAMDFLKIDVQGAELMVFQGGHQVLAEAVAVQTEVSFVPLYEGQPTFGDIDQELRAQGFLPHAMPALKRWAIAPVVIDDDVYRPLNQLLEADVVYVRDFAHSDRMSDEQLKHLAMIAHHVYGSFDLAHHCVAALASRGVLAAYAPEAYLAQLSG
ncbi:FkbM family methyltransferase [Kineococcus radiotolerans]|uniref:FkbM family methyltransferase n=1 Tax=Kineococcus radiotolerans TaxID=131568 RepID=A0A7W4XVY5_KINRA|nr:FkbM family methyltransferase [Kineococcus radiotolerans]MBB2899674.1 FkbM family methyltransferase [Kineococcus radiotolerans]